MGNGRGGNKTGNWNRVNLGYTFLIQFEASETVSVKSIFVGRREISWKWARKPRRKGDPKIKTLIIIVAQEDPKESRARVASTTPLFRSPNLRTPPALASPEPSNKVCLFASLPV